MATMTARPTPSRRPANGTFATGGLLCDADGIRQMPLTCGYVVERVTRIELALSAWEVGVAGRAWPADAVTCVD
jgi:hypothetical protein